MQKIYRSLCLMFMSCLTMNSIAASDQRQKKVKIKIKYPLEIPVILETWRSRLRETRSAACECRVSNDKVELGRVINRSKICMYELNFIQPETLTGGWRQERARALTSFKEVHDRMSEIYKAIPVRLISKNS